MSQVPLTVALISTQRLWHGGEEQARLLALGLRRRGHRCEILARRGGEFARRMADEGFSVMPFSGGGRNLSAFFCIRKTLHRLRPDVLHYNDPHAITAGGFAALRLPIPIRIASRRVAFPIRSPRVYRWFADRVLCVSNSVEQICVAAGLPRAMLRVVHDGVDTARIREGDRRRGRASLEVNDDETLLLTVASLTPPKGHVHLLDALPDVLKSNPKITVSLAGDGELRESLERQAERLGIRSRVRFLGYRRDANDLIQAADLFVLPSVLEGLCSTLIDTMLAGRPIVATTAGGIPDLLAPTDAGPLAWLVPPGDPAALRDAILRALASPTECAEMQRRAAERALQHFTADSMVENTLATYRK